MTKFVIAERFMPHDVKKLLLKFSYGLVSFLYHSKRKWLQISHRQNYPSCFIICTYLTKHHAAKTYGWAEV